MNRKWIVLTLLALGACMAPAKTAPAPVKEPEKKESILKERLSVTCGYGAGRYFGEVYRGPYCDAVWQVWPE